MSLAFKLPAIKDDADPQLNGAISAGDVTIALKTGHGAKLPVIYTGTASSAGDARTLNDTGDLGDVSVGDFIENVTDGSWAVVITAGAGSVRTTPLRGGSDNTWSSGDTWAVNRFYCRLTQYDGDGEIVKKEKILVSNRSTDTLTVTRGQDGDSAVSFDADDYCNLFVLKVHTEEMQNALCEAFMQIDEIARGTYGYAADSGVADAYAVTLSPPVTALSDITGKLIVFKATNANTGASTLAVNGLSATAIKKEGGASDLAAGDIAASMPVVVTYNGTAFTMVSAVANAPAGNDLTIENETADYTVLASESKKLFTNSGAGVPVTFTLPSASAGKNVQFAPVDDLIFVKAASGDVIKHVSTSQSLGAIQTNQMYSTLKIVAIDSTNWIIESLVGNWAGDTGYILGGSTNTSGGTMVAVIENFSFSASTSAAVSATLSAASRAGGEGGVNNDLAGYMFGGSDASDNAISTIAKLTWITETRSNLSATLDATKYGSAGVETQLYGYGIGGESESGAKTSINKLIFSTEAEADISATLAAGRGRATPCYSGTAGYSLGGNNSGAQTSIYKLTFSSEATSTPADTLGTGSFEAAAVQHRLAGYKMGGSGTTTAIVKFTYSTETDSVLAATLDTATQGNTGLHMNFGVSAGGRNGGTESNAIEDLDFADESSSVLAAALDTAKEGCCGIQPVCI